MGNATQNKTLIELFADADLNQAELARKLGTSERMVYRWLKEGVVPGRYWRPRIARVFKTPQALIDWKVES